MSEKVELSVQADFGRIMQDLAALQRKTASVSDGIRKSGSELDKSLERGAKNTEKHFERVRDLGRRLADQLRGYFADVTSSAAYALEGVKKGFGIKQHLMDAATGALDLHDAIRKIGDSLGIASNRLVDFQQNVTKAFSEAGFGAGETVRALQGLAGTKVSGEANVTSYGVTAARLAQNGGQVGQEGEIAKALAEVLRARGIDQNNIPAMSSLAENVRGRNPLDKLQVQKGLYEGMDDQKRKEIGPEAMRGLMAVAKTIGPELMGALITETTEGRLKRLGRDAQGASGIIGKNGVDFDKLAKLLPVLNRIGMDKVASGQTAGFSEQASKALVMLSEQFQEAKAAQTRAMAGGGTLEGDTTKSRGVRENFGAVKNRVTGVTEGVIAPLIAKANDVIGGASKSTLGSAALMGGGFLAATMGAGGLSALSKSFKGKLGGGMLESGAKAAALEQITGEKTIPVYVVNLGEMSGAMEKLTTKLPGGGGGSSVVDKANVAATGLAIGLVVGSVIEEAMNKHTQGKSMDGQFTGNIAERGMYTAAKGLAPLLEMFRGQSDSVDSILKMFERNAQEKRQRDFKTTSPGTTRAAAAAFAAPGKK